MRDNETTRRVENYVAAYSREIRKQFYGDQADYIARAEAVIERVESDLFNTVMGYFQNNGDQKPEEKPEFREDVKEKIKKRLEEIEKPEDNKND